MSVGGVTIRDRGRRSGPHYPIINGHRLDHRYRHDGHARNPLRHDHNPQRLYSPPASTEIGRFVGRHLPHRLFVLQILEHSIRPSRSQHIQQLAAIGTLMRDQHESPMVAADYSGEADRTPSSKASRRAVTESLKPRRSRRTASGKPSGDRMEMMASVAVVAVSAQ